MKLAIKTVRLKVYGNFYNSYLWIFIRSIFKTGSPVFIMKSFLFHKQRATQPAIACSKLTINTLEQGVNMFKVNNKDTRTRQGVKHVQS